MRTFLLVILLSPPASFVIGQTPEEIKESFNEGAFFFTREDYKEASFYLKKVVQYHPDNAHFNFMLGECYMNIPGEEAMAIPCFEKATRYDYTVETVNGKLTLKRK